MADMLVEGNPNPGNPLTGDDLPAPTFCPLCGRGLVGWRWVTVQGNYFYPFLACWGDAPRLWAAVQRKWFTITKPTGAHYAFQLPAGPVVKRDVYRFDPQSGDPLDAR